jgi:hypothetical protein
MESNKAIVALTRGYSDVSKYKDLILRNVGIWNTINNDCKYALILFHEGNISDEHQEYIRNNSMGQKIVFINISHLWQGGYEGMCRFMIYDIWEMCKDYKYVMRIDEDCILQKSMYDPFDQIENAFADYMVSAWWAESHSETNATLPQFIADLTGANPKEFYNDKYPYTNVCVAKVEFMRNLKELRVIAESPLQKVNRWGDLPVIGSLLNIYGKKKIGTLNGLSYYHSSHNVSIHCE